MTIINSHDVRRTLELTIRHHRRGRGVCDTLDEVFYERKEISYADFVITRQVIETLISSGSPIYFLGHDFGDFLRVDGTKNRINLLSDLSCYCEICAEEVDELILELHEQLLRTDPSYRRENVLRQIFGNPRRST